MSDRTGAIRALVDEALAELPWSALRVTYDTGHPAVEAPDEYDWHDVAAAAYERAAARGLIPLDWIGDTRRVFARPECDSCRGRGIYSIAESPHDRGAGARKAVACDCLRDHPPTARLLLRLLEADPGHVLRREALARARFGVARAVYACDRTTERGAHLDDPGEAIAHAGVARVAYPPAQRLRWPWPMGPALRGKR